MINKKTVQEKKVAILKGLAHPVRLTIVEALADGEMCVCEIGELFQYDRTTISKHLSLMKSLDILSDRKDGLRVYYRLKIRCLPSILFCVEKIAKGRNPKAVFSN